MNIDWIPTVSQTLFRVVGIQHWTKEHNSCPQVTYIPVGGERQAKLSEKLDTDKCYEERYSIIKLKCQTRFDRVS